MAQIPRLQASLTSETQISTFGEDVRYINHRRYITLLGAIISQWD